MTGEIATALGLFTLAYIAMLVYATRRDGAVGSGDLTEFFVSGRNLGIWRAVATLGATEIGVITIAYNAQKGFNEGFAAFHIGIAALIGAGLVGLTGFVVAPLRRTGVLTVPEYYGQRFGRDVRVLGAAIMALAGILNMGLFLKVASLFIVTLLGVEAGETAMTILMIALVAIAAAYTCYGGMRSVITTDVFQFVMILIGLTAGLVAVLSLVTLNDAVTVVSEQKGRAGFDPFQNANFGATYVLWMIFVAGIVSSAIWPTALSRALCIQDEETVRRAYLWSAPVFMGRMVAPAFLGVLAFTYFQLAEAGTAGDLGRFGTDSDLASTPAMLHALLPGWLAAFLAVALFATFMSTQDSYLFCWSSIIARDVLGPVMGRTEDASFQVRMTRLFIVLIAIYEVYWGLFYSGDEDIWDYIAISGSIYFCSGVVLLAGGLYWPRATRRGALLALIGGFSAIAGLGPVKDALGLADVSAPVIGFAAIAISLLGLVIGSLTEKNAGAQGV